MKTPMVRIRVAALAAFAALLLVAAGARRADAQSATPLGMFVQTYPTPSAYPADWQATQSLAQAQIFNSNNVPVTGFLFGAILIGNTVVGQTDNQFQYFPTGVTILDTPRQVKWGTLKLTGKTREVFERTGRLPDGTYRVQLLFVNGQTLTGIPVPFSEGSSSFTVSFPKPPALIAPSDRAVVKIATPVFQWQPVFDATGTQPDYLFRLVEILPGQMALRAIEANRPVFETTISGSVTPTLTYPAEAPLLQPGRAYAWRVQAVTESQTLPGAPAQTTVYQPFGQNEGRSSVYTFTAAIPGRHAIDQGALPDGAIGAAGPGGAPGANPGVARGAGKYDETGEDDTFRPTAPTLGNFADRLLHALVSTWSPDGKHGAPLARISSSWKKDQQPSGGSSGTSGGSSGTSGGSSGASGGTSGTSGDTPPASGGEAAPSTGDANAGAAPGTPVDPNALPPAEPEGGLGPQWLRLHGTASLTSEAYSHDGYGTPSRPDRSARVVTGLNVGLLQDKLRVPIDALVSGDQVSFRQNINQVGLMPRFEWAGLMAGNFSPQYSNFTLADATVLGGGFDLTPKKWRIGFVDGRARKAIAPSETELVQPQFSRDVTAGHLGYGDPQANNLDFAIMRARDDSGSLGKIDSTLLVTPEGNTVYSLRGQGVMPGRHLTARLETAFSKYDRDRRADVGSVDGRAIGLDLARETGSSQTGARFEYLNGGFMSLGNSGITGDRIGVTLSQRALLMQGKLTLDGSAGWRNDAVSDVVTSPTKRKNFALTGSWTASERFGTDAQMSIYTTNADAADSTGFNMDNTTRLYSVTPHVLLPVGRFRNTLSGSAVVQVSDNSTDAPVPAYDTKSLSLLANWSGAFNNFWSVNFTGNYTKTDFEIGVTEVSIFGPGITWNTPDARFQGTVQLQVTRSRTGNAGVDTEAAPRLDVRWSFAKKQALVLKGNFRRYKYADPTVAQFNERLASLEYVTNL